MSLLLIFILLTLSFNKKDVKYADFEQNHAAPPVKPQEVPVLPSQKANLNNDEKMLKEIREMTKHAWSSYKKYAWGDDELVPIAKLGKNWTSYSFLFTPVDSLDTLFIMGLEEEYKECKQLVLSKLNFDIDSSRLSDNYNHFEITIRVLGGLLSAYELDPDEGYLRLAVDLGNRLIGAFDKKTGIPPMWFNIGSGTSKSRSGLLATIGTIQLELQYLSDVTRNPIYQDKVGRFKLI